MAIRTSPALAFIVLTGLLAGCKSQEQREREAFIAQNCPGMTDYTGCQLFLKSKEHDAKHRAQLSAAPPPSTAPAPVAAPTKAATPVTTAERARILAGIADLKALVLKRTANGVAADTEETCDARQSRMMVAAKAAESKIGEERMLQKTRFAMRAPDLGQDLGGVVSTCLMGCLLDEESDPGHKDGREFVYRSCRQSATALDDLAEQVEALPSK
ncbi:MAG: hypothetical protein BGO98_13620 [Myxococcales bacterium 68-20]|nr:hypothetical protein [Myxococcales bacterium]OJY17177.1 MAG: hypothetical protein BGO98_13620 [Myxococcales bacterium 68-20]